MHLHIVAPEVLSFLESLHCFERLKLVSNLTLKYTTDTQWQASAMLEVKYICHTRTCPYMLLLTGADPNVETKINETIIHVAAASGELQIIEYLVDTYRYDVTYLNKGTSGGVCKIQGKPLPSGGWTALHYACAGGHAPVVKYLLKMGVNWKIRSDEEIAPKDLVKIFKHMDTIMPLFPTTAAEKKDWKNF